jgi:hypothetical protein
MQRQKDGERDGRAAGGEKMGEREEMTWHQPTQSH